MMAKQKSPKKPRKRTTRARSAVRGEWATEVAAQANPREHVRERVERVLGRRWAIVTNDGVLITCVLSLLPLLYATKKEASRNRDGDERVVRVRIVSEER